MRDSRSREVAIREVSKLGLRRIGNSRYRADDLLTKKRSRTCSAMAFIKSGGTVFPTLAPRVVANFPDARFLPTCQAVCVGDPRPVLRICLLRAPAADYNDLNFRSF